MHLRDQLGISLLVGGLLAGLSPIARAAPLGVGTVELGIYGALGIPVAQEDVNAGPLYGAKVRVGIIPILKAEISGTLFDFGDGEVDFPPVIAALHEVGYAGGVHVELSRHIHEGPAAARRAYRFLKPLIDSGPERPIR